MTHTAGTVVRLLIQHPGCLGPGYLGEKIGLELAFHDSMELLRKSSKFTALSRQATLVTVIPSSSNGGIVEETDGHHGLIQRRNSNLTLNKLTAKLTLSFYTGLVRLLASCAPLTAISSSTTSSSSSSSSTMADDCIRSFLKSLITLDEISNILSIPLSEDHSKGISPVHKASLIMFLCHVYEVRDPNYLLLLLKKAFIPDVRLALKKKLVQSILH